MSGFAAMALAAALAAAPQASVTRVADGWRADLELDGTVLGWAIPRVDGGRRDLYVLVGPPRASGTSKPAAPCGPRAARDERSGDARLFRWTSSASDRLEPVASGLPEGTLETADLDGDGSDELLLVRAGAIDRVDPGGAAPHTRELVADVEIGASCCGPRAGWDEGGEADASLRVSVLGAFRTYRGEAAGPAKLVSEVETPQRVSPGRYRVRVESPSVTTVGRLTETGRMTFATEPEAMGKRRLRTWILDPDGPLETQAVESWGLFPGLERIVESAFGLLNGAPVLLVTTTSAEKLSLLNEKSLRVFPLAGDRTRAGAAPLYATTTGMNLWQQAFPTILDLDRDGRDELVVAYWKGLKNAIAAIEVYRGSAAATLSAPRSMSFDVNGGDKAFLKFGPDADGDGRPDLILLAAGELQVYPGAAPEKACNAPVGTKPSRRIALPSAFSAASGRSFSMGTEGIRVERSDRDVGTPLLADLDGDGRPEVLLAGRSGDGGSRFVVVFVKGR